jgi:hypothetical protein
MRSFENILSILNRNRHIKKSDKTISPIHIGYKELLIIEIIESGLDILTPKERLAIFCTSPMIRYFMLQSKYTVYFFDEIRHTEGFIETLEVIADGFDEHVAILTFQEHYF